MHENVSYFPTLTATEPEEISWETVKKTFTSHYHETKTIEVELFTWEKLDAVNKIKKCFNL